MNLSLKWLNDYIDTNDIEIKEFCDSMTMSGSKVEGYKNTGDGIENVVAGRIISCDKHPNADKLTICMVDIGQVEPIQIVTGADNVNPGDLVPIAKDKSKLPGGVEIRRGKLRGVESNGMMCSLSELGLTVNDYPYAVEDGIFVMQEECKPGQDIREVLELNDYIVEFEITSNRPDCLSVIGLAREAAATFNRVKKIPNPYVKESSGDIKDYLNVTVSEPELCSRYSARVVKNIKIEPSPRWLRERLRASGVRPINNIVDITNYVMLEYGQPMHAFDYNCLNGKNIDVRLARKDEKMDTLDGQSRELTEGMLVIADAEKPVAIAGVMGGANSEIEDTTVTVVFESANFSGACVRRTSRKLGLRTESSSRFEKGLDANNTIPALERACELVEEFNAGEVVKGMIDVDNSSKPPVRLLLDSGWINTFLGTDIKKETMTEILNRLDFVVGEDDIIVVPSFRSDVEHNADIAEEVARIYGYNNIPSTLSKGKISQGMLSKKQKFIESVNNVLLSCGLSEITTYSFISPKYNDKILMPQDSIYRKAVKILNPLGEDTSIMRTTTLPSMLEVLVNNYNFRNQKAYLYEIGTVYLPKDDINELPEEKNIITIGIYGKDADYYLLKGIIEELLEKININNFDLSVCKDDNAFHPGRAAKISKNGIDLGIMGEIHPKIRENYDIEIPVYCAMLDLEVLYTLRDEEKKYTPLPKYPSVTRDIAILCADSTMIGDLKNEITNAAGNLLENIELFDVYKGSQIAEGYKSVAFSLDFRAKDRTLSDEDADRLMKKILRNLERIGAKLR